MGKILIEATILTIALLLTFLWPTGGWLVFWVAFILTGVQFIQAPNTAAPILGIVILAFGSGIALVAFLYSLVYSLWNGVGNWGIYALSLGILCGIGQRYYLLRQFFWLLLLAFAALVMTWLEGPWINGQDTGWAFALIMYAWKLLGWVVTIISGKTGFQK